MPFGSIKEQVHSGGYSRGYVPRTAPRTPPPLSRGGPPLAPKPAPKPSGVFTRPLSQQLFAPAQQHAQQRVEATRPRSAPAPYIPRLPNPTREQVQTALRIALRAQARAVGPNPGVQRIREYHQELLSDPRSQEYVQTLTHYQRAGEAQQAETAGRVAAGGGQNAASALTPAARKLSSTQAIRLGSAALARAAAQQPQSWRPAPAPKGIGVPVLGTIVTGSAVQGIQRAVASAVPNLAAKVTQVEGVGRAASELATGSPAAKQEGRGTIAQNALVDLARLPANTIGSVAQLGSAGVSAAGGNTKPLSAIGSSLLQQLEHPVQTFKEHPVSTTLMAAGVEEALGKGLGAVARTGALGGAVRSAASTARPDLKLYNDMAVSRRYSADPLRKAVEVMTERARARSEGQMHTAPGQAAGLRLRRAIKGGPVHPGEVDVSIDTGEQLRRRLRGEVTKSITGAMPKHGADAVPLIAEGIVRSPQTLLEDLQKERARLIDAQGGAHTVRRGASGVTGISRTSEPLTGTKLAANRENVARIDGLLKDKKFLENPAPAFASAAHFAETTQPLTQGLLRVGHLEPEQLRARLFPYAQAHMGARYFTVADHQAAEAAARQAGLSPARVAAVSGRGPVDQVLAHEGVLAGHAEARSAVPKAQEALRRVEAARSRLVGAQRVGGTFRVQETRAVAGGGNAMAAAEAKVVGAREALRAAQERHTVIRNAARGSKLPEIRPGLRKANGEHLPTAEIEAHARANGVNQIGFLSHEESLTGRGSFFKSTTRRPALASKQRTGVSFDKGTYHRGYEALVAQSSRLAQDYAAHHATDQRLSRFGIGSYASHEEALREAENFAHTPEGQRITNNLGPLKPVPVGPERVRLQRNVQPGSSATAREQFAIEQHKPVSEAAQPAGKYTLLPETVTQRLAEHDALLGGTQGKKLMQKFTNQWRQTMLFTSPRWLLGNPQEQGIRLVWGGAAPRFIGGRSGRFAERLVNAYDQIGRSNTPEASAAREALASLVRGSHYTAAEQLAIVRKADQFAGSTLTGPALSATERSSESGLLHTVVGPWRAWRNVVGKGMTTLERESRKAALGKVAIRDVHDFTGKWRNVMGMTDQAVTEYARGTLTHAKTAQLVREVDEMMGAWGHLTPSVRSAVQTWSPFGLWWMTSMRFLRRLPIDHPVKTAITAAIYNATQHLREERPAEAPWEVGGIHAHLPLGLGGVILQPTYYSPAGVGIEPGTTVADMVLPQVTEPLQELRGRDALTGEALTAPGRTRSGQKPNAVQTAEIIANTLAQGLIPGYRQAEQLRQQGGKTYSTSNLFSPQIKTGTQRSLEQTLTKIISPLRFYWEKHGSRGTSSGASTTSTSPRDLIREGLRNEALQSHERDAVREAIREGLRREAIGR